ncbi:hypothetical protein AMECASPLE_022432 [Ameca splendens]|uniref:Ig-like domain-containing protein n=1 Tax=Ameca splendens TaxID=208324 RepID=A0ABV0Y447_9TELE
MINLIFFCLITGFALGLDVHQSHSDLIMDSGKKVQIFCTHEKTDFWIMLWYQRSPADTVLKLIGHVNTNDVTMEDKNDKNVKISGDLSGNTAKNTSLIIDAVEQKHTAVYYCAAREAH